MNEAAPNLSLPLQDTTKTKASKSKRALLSQEKDNSKFDPKSGSFSKNHMDFVYENSKNILSKSGGIGNIGLISMDNANVKKLSLTHQGIQKADVSTLALIGAVAEGEKRYGKNSSRKFFTFKRIKLNK